MHRLSGRILLIAAAFALFLVPVAAIAAGGFDDVEDDSVFKADIDWLATAGVTKGCNPPTNDEFCPEGNVTREQMAAFMHRLAVNKVVDAKTALTADHANEADVAATAGSAANADKLDGKDSTAFAVTGHDHDAAYLAKNDKATDADKLDGKDSTAFAQASDVYTKGEIDSSTASKLVAGGWVNGDGTTWTSVANFGDFAVSRTGTGQYWLEFLGVLDPDCNDPYALVIIDPQSRYTSSVTVLGKDCPGGGLSGDTTIYFNMQDTTGALVDTAFKFTAYVGGGGLSPASSSAQSSWSRCTLDVATGVETCE